LKHYEKLILEKRQENVFTGEFKRILQEGLGKFIGNTDKNY